MRPSGAFARSFSCVSPAHSGQERIPFLLGLYGHLAGRMPLEPGGHGGGADLTGVAAPRATVQFPRLPSRVGRAGPGRSRAQAADCYSGPSRFSSTLMIVIALIGPPPAGPHGATPIGD